MTVDGGDIEPDTQTFFYKNNGGVWSEVDASGPRVRVVRFTYTGTTIRLVLKQHESATMPLSRRRTLESASPPGVALATWDTAEGETVTLSFPTPDAPIPPDLFNEWVWSYFPKALSSNKPTPLNVKVKIRRPA